MTTLRKISDWLKYERLHHYPALAAFDRVAALKRLEAYEREEREACQPWLTIVWIVTAVFFVAWVVFSYFSFLGQAFMIVMQIPGWILQYVLHRRIKRRVEAKVAAELRDGRLWKCVDCDYDLRASEERCPECGAPVRVGPKRAVTSGADGIDSACESPASKSANAMRADETPFPAGWWGQGLGGVRPDVTTYGRYPHEQLPPLPFELRGDFEWLSRQPVQVDNIAREKAAENENACAALIGDASGRGTTLPGEFLTFFRSSELQHRVRSCTDCFLDLSPVFVPSPIADRFLLRFLADSQGCIFWYLYLRRGSIEHCVVASPDFYGAEEEQWQEEPPDPAQIVFCEESFERFLCRFWLENEIWYCGYEKRPLFAEARQYLETYGRTP